MKHSKTQRPSDADLLGNPLIGGSKGVRMAQASPDDLNAARGANTIEGDIENDSNRFGGVDKALSRGARRSRRPRL